MHTRNRVQTSPRRSSCTTPGMGQLVEGRGAGSRPFDAVFQWTRVNLTLFVLLSDGPRPCLLPSLVSLPAQSSPVFISHCCVHLVTLTHYLVSRRTQPPSMPLLPRPTRPNSCSSLCPRSFYLLNPCYKIVQLFILYNRFLPSTAYPWHLIGCLGGG